MVIPVHGPQGPKTTDKAKAKARTGAAEGPSFAETLAAAEAADHPAASTPLPLASGLALPSYVPANEDDVPQDTRGQTAALLKTLRELAEAALGGSATVNRSRLQQLAEGHATDEASLTPDQRQVVNEARTRAAVEAAKIEKP